MVAVRWRQHAYTVGITVVICTIVLTRFVATIVHAVAVDLERAALRAPALVTIRNLADGEKVGDILRYCTEWKMGLPGGMASPMATISSFSGAGMSYQLGLFDVVKQGKNWNDLVEALVSNTPERTEEVTLVFERPTK